jgi:hypothetical protein
LIDIAIEQKKSPRPEHLGRGRTNVALRYFKPGLASLFPRMAHAR